MPSRTRLTDKQRAEFERRYGAAEVAIASQEGAGESAQDADHAESVAPVEVTPEEQPHVETD